jgi:regulator of sigma E protease
VATVLAWIVVFSVLVAVHELGHFFMAKTLGMRVDEYSLGFGPPLFKHRWGDTLYALRLIPLGGYVRLAGMEGGSSADPRDYPNRPWWQRFVVILAGPFMNLVLAAVLYALLFGPIGVPAPTTVVGQLLPHFPAQSAGLRPGDQIVAVNGQIVHDWNQLDQLIRAHARHMMSLTVRRGQRFFQVHLRGQWDPPLKTYLIGIEPAMRLVHQRPWAALATGVSQTGQLTVQWFQALFALITGHSRFDVTGPVGIAVLVGRAVKEGLSYLVLLAAGLSVNLALFNILPIPVLDGSRLFLLMVEAVRKKAMDPERESLIHLVGMALLLLFVAFVTYHDLVHYLHLD